MYLKDLMIGVFMPFAGTVLGSACVFFMKRKASEKAQSVLSGAAGGVMTAAGIWSLIIPAIEQSSFMKKFSFVPVTVGFWLGILLLAALDRFFSDEAVLRMTKCRDGGAKRTCLLVLSVTLHNIPEGMAVGIVYAALLNAAEGVTVSHAFALALGIAIQNVPEGAVISMPLKSAGLGRTKAFFCGSLSGAVEPAAAFLTVLISPLIIPAMPYFLGFAAGAMIWVTVKELIPSAVGPPVKNAGAFSFSLGFTLMMVLDVAFGV